MNEVLLTQVSKLISTLEAGSAASRSPEEIVLQALVNISSDEGGNKLFTPPPGTPSYSQMMGSLFDSIKKEIDEENPDNRWNSFLNKLQEHKVKLTGVYEETGKRLEVLEKEVKAKITSDSIHDGFSAGHVTKGAPPPTNTKKPTVVGTVEQLNPGVKYPANASASGVDADVEEGGETEEDEGHIEPTALGKEFSKIKMGDYRTCMEFISRNPTVVAERETDGLLIEAFNSQIAGKGDYAKRCVHQALLLQYCRQLGRDGVALFFKRYDSYR
jgi:cell division cycle protein 37